MDIIVFSVLIVTFFGVANAQGRTPAPNFYLESSVPDNLIVRWDLPATSATITGWRIQYRESGQKKRQMDIDGALTEKSITGLKADTSYKVRMMAITSAGNGKYSQWKGVTTASVTAVVTEPAATIPAPDSPQNVAVVAAPTTARLTWNPPVDNGAEIVGYVVSYGPLNNPRENVHTLRPNPTQSDLDGLTPNTQYQLAITAYNTVGQSYPARLDFYTTAEQVVTEAVEEVVPGPPPQPQNVRYESITPTSLRITWTLPATTAADEIENVRFGFGDEGTRVEYLPSSNLGKDATSYIAEQLSPATRYTVMVVTENRYGQSNPVLLTVETIPNPVSATDAPPQQECPAAVVECFHEYEGRLVNLNPNDPTFCVIIKHYANCLLSVPQVFRASACYGTLVTPLTHAYNFCAVPAEKSWSPVPSLVVVPPPAQLRADVLSPTTVRLTFIDPSFGQVQDVTNDRYYTLRYKRDADPGFEYANIRETTYILDQLQPESNYQFEIMVVLGRDLQSEYTTVYAFTRDPSREDMVRGVTAIQVKVTNPGLLSAVINWLPPQTGHAQIRGYVLEYTSGIDLRPSNVWERIDINTPVPSATVEPLTANTTYHVRVAPRTGNQLGDFSNPPEVFLTPTVPPSGQPLHVCSSSETLDQVVERVSWMRDGGGVVRPALVGVPLPYCDDYYGIHECHGLVCFCIPGKRPRTDAACRSGGLQGDQPFPGLQGDQPFPGFSSAAAPCRAEYEAGKRAMAERRTAGKTLYGVHLPYCTDDGYYHPKQCMGSVCYCSTRDGQHTGKEVPLWDVDTLHC